MTDWTVHLDAKGTETVDLDQVGQLLDELAEYSGAVAGGNNGYSATITVDATNAVEAASVGVGTFRRAASRANLPELPIVRVEVETTDETDAELARPTPRLVGISEIAELLGVTRQRASVLQTREGFPAPAAVLKSGPVWMLRDIDTFQSTWSRTPGRPLKHADKAAIEKFKQVRQDAKFPTQELDPTLARLAGKE